MGFCKNNELLNYFLEKVGDDFVNTVPENSHKKPAAATFQWRDR